MQRVVRGGGPQLLDDGGGARGRDAPLRGCPCVPALRPAFSRGQCELTLGPRGRPRHWCGRRTSAEASGLVSGESPEREGRTYCLVQIFLFRCAPGFGVGLLGWAHMRFPKPPPLPQPHLPCRDRLRLPGGRRWLGPLAKGFCP